MQALKWKLNIDGDFAERVGWPLLKDKFPNYEIFWSQFIVPMTCRTDLPHDHKLWLQFKQNVSPILQRVAMSHYTIFRNLLFAHEIVYLHDSLANTLPFTWNEKVDNFYIAIGSTIEMVENIWWQTWVLKRELKLEQGSPMQELNRDAFMREAADFYDKKYKNGLKDLLEKKKNVIWRIHTFSEALALIKDNELRARFEKFRQEMQTYRNAIIHNPQMGTFYIEGVPYIPKNSDLIKKYELWGNLLYGYEMSDFERTESVLLHHFDLTQKLLNDVWKHLIDEYNTVERANGYSGLLGSVPGSRATPRQNPFGQSRVRTIITNSGAASGWGVAGKSGDGYF